MLTKRSVVFVLLLLVGVSLIGFSSGAGENCAETIYNIPFTGVSGMVGISNGDNRFYCLDGRFYECNWTITNNTFAQEVGDNYITLDGNYRCDLSESEWVPVSPSALTPRLVPLNRFFNPSISNHRYSTTATIQGLGIENYAYEGVDAYIYTTRVSDMTNLVPLYQYYSDSNKDHFYTGINSENKSSLKSIGYDYNGVAGYIYSSQIAGTVPLYRLWHSGVKDHYYTVSESDKIMLNSSSHGWNYESIIGYVFAPCTRICGRSSLDNNNGLRVPSVEQYEGSANMRVPSGVLIDSNGNFGNYGYEFWWQYNYLDGSSQEFCDCNFSKTASFSDDLNSDLKIFSGFLNSPLYNFNFTVINDFDKIISNITLRVATRNNRSMSNFTNPITINIFNPSCPVVVGCDVVGKNISIGEENKYRTCERKLNGCFNWSDVKICAPSSYIYSSELGKCVASGQAFTCLGPSGTNNKFCFNGSSIPYGAHLENANCVVSSLLCIACNDSYSWSEIQKECTRNNCVDNCSIFGGVCLNVSAGNALVNSALNGSLDCCTSKSCYKCNSGYHYFNGSCILNDCVGLNPTGFNFTRGANFTLVGNNRWMYSPQMQLNALGACQWKCDNGFRINISNNNTCIFGLPNCTTEVGGFCSGSVLNGSYFVNASCDSGSCYVCDASAGYSWNGSACVLGRNCPNGLEWTGASCEPPIVCNNGCVYGGKCYAPGFRLNVPEIGRVYCDAGSKTLLDQKNKNISCEYNYECQTNLCSAEGKCYDIIEEIRRSTGYLRQIWCWIKTGFSWGSGAWDSCLASDFLDE